MDASLRLIADAVASHALALSFTQGKPMKEPKKLSGPIFWLVIWPKAAVLGVRWVRGLHTALQTAPPRVELERLYREATGVGNDRSTADLKAVEDRLVRLGRLWEPDDEPLVRAAAPRLIEWVANGQPAGDERWNRMEQAFQTVSELHGELMGDFYKRAPRYAVAQGEYRAAWQHALLSAG